MPGALRSGWSRSTAFPLPHSKCEQSLRKPRTPYRVRAGYPVFSGEAARRVGARRPLGLARCGLAALAAGCLLLLRRAALAGVALARRARSGLLASAARRALRVGDRRCPALAHALLAQALVLLIVLDAGTVIFRHVRGLPGDRGA